MDELTMIRNQMASIKQSLERSNIINKNLMDKVMRQRSSWLDNTVWAEVVSIPIITFLIYQVSESIGLSIWYAIIFFIGSAIDTALDFKTLKVPKIWFSEMDVITLRKKLQRQKLQRKVQYIISISFAAVWGVVFGFQYLSKETGKYMTHDTAATIIILSIVGVIVCAGVGVSFLIYRKAQRTNDDILKQIDDYALDS